MHISSNQSEKKMIEGDSLYVKNVTMNDNQSIVFGACVIVNVNLIEKTCFCSEYNWIKILCAHKKIVFVIEA